jgi:hypothetical protein
MFTTMRSCVVHMNHVSRSKVKIRLRGIWKTLVWSKTSTCIEGLHKCLPLWDGVSHVKFRSLWHRSRSLIGVKVQIKYENVLSHHLLMDWNTNGYYHDYSCVTCDKGLICARIRSLKMIVKVTKGDKIQILSGAYLLHLWRDSNETSNKRLTLRSCVMRMN